MFVRKKKNPSGVVSIQVVDKSKGGYKVLKTIGSSSEAHDIDRLYQQGKKWISVHTGESDYSDDLRERGFSKDGKHSQPQVVLGLLVSRDGYPLSYSLFNGSHR